MFLGFELIAVHNHLGRAPITWFSFLLRLITGLFYNHIAIRIYDLQTRETIGVIEAVWPRVKFWDKYEDWQHNANRTCEGFTLTSGPAKVPASLIFRLIGKNYGLADLYQLLRVIINTIWLGRTNYQWNGRRGTGFRPGYTCSELGYTIAGRPNAHLAIPGQIKTDPAFSSTGVFYTTKKKK